MKLCGVKVMLLMVCSSVPSLYLILQGDVPVNATLIFVELPSQMVVVVGVVKYAVGKAWIVTDACVLTLLSQVPDL